ncbi:MAG: hypothetical protein ACI8W8_004670, partial [Rhodothermales bacterium]
FNERGGLFHPAPVARWVRSASYRPSGSLTHPHVLTRESTMLSISKLNSIGDARRGKFGAAQGLKPKGEEKMRIARIRRESQGTFCHVMNRAAGTRKLISMLARSVRDNRLIKGAAAMVSDDLHLARLLCEGRDSIDAYADMATFLARAWKNWAWRFLKT